MADLAVRPAGPGDAEAVAEIHDRAWGGPVVVGHGVRYDLTALPTLVAVDGSGAVAGALAYRVGADDLEVVSIAAARHGEGAGTALIEAAAREARGRGLRRLWLVTTNDNLRALRFYQRRALRIDGVAVGAVDAARRIKPMIPLVGDDGIPLRDELTLVLRLDGAGTDEAAGAAAARHTTGSRLDVLSLLRDPAGTADVVRGLAGPVRGRVDAVIDPGGAEPVHALAALVAYELRLPLVEVLPAKADVRAFDVPAALAGLLAAAPASPAPPAAVPGHNEAPASTDGAPGTDARTR